jgi:hypothetical protein
MTDSRLMRLVGEKMGQEQYGDLVWICAADIEPEPVTWLWKDMIPQGKITLFAGESGIGKTQVLCNIMSRVSTGRPFPGTSTPAPIGKSLYLSGDNDGNKDTIIPRLIACGADRSKIVIQGSTKADGDGYALYDELDNITQRMHDDGGFKLFIIDPLTSFFKDGHDNNSATSVRRLLSRLGDLAEETGVAVVHVNHLTKDVNRKLVHRILGSGAYTQGSRVVMAAVKAGDNFYLGKVNANVTSDQGVYKYQMESKTILSSTGWPIECWYVEIDDEVIDEKIEEFHQIAISTRGDKGNSAQFILEEELEDGLWHLKQHLVEAVQRKIQISERQLDRIAKSNLHVEMEWTNEKPARAKWRLPVALDITDTGNV